jgi:hypothetical protein
VEDRFDKVAREEREAAERAADTADWANDPAAADGHRRAAREADGAAAAQQCHGGDLGA